MFLILFTSCSKEKKSVKNYNLPVELKDDTYLIFRLGKGYFSNVFRRLSSKEMIYSHVGIVHRCDSTSDCFKVYHIEASEFTGKGKPKKESLETFIQNSKYWGIYGINTTDSLKVEIIKQADLYCKKNIEFDLDFDLESDDKLYCSEFVAKSINNAFGYSVIKANLNISGKLFFGLDDIYSNQLIRFVYSTKE